MNRLFSLKLLVALGLLIGLVIGYFFAGPIPGSANAGSSTPTLTLPPQPFVTLPGAWMVRFQMFRSKAPEIISLTRIEAGRLTILQPGENKIQILDSYSQVAYEQSFQVEFMHGDPPQPVDEITQIFVLPVIDGAHTLVIVTPQGQTRYEISTP